LLMQGRGVSF